MAEVGKMFLHNCYCGRWGAFGFGVFKDKPGVWLCAEHKVEGRMMEDLGLLARQKSKLSGS
jgi:hypothetical protein